MPVGTCAEGKSATRRCVADENGPGPTSSAVSWPGSCTFQWCKPRGAALPVAYERLLDDLLQLRGAVGSQRRQWHRCRGHHGLDDCQRVRTLKERTAGQHLVGDDSQRPKI